MTGFVNIRSVFDNDRNRTIDALKEVYKDRNQLVKLISDITLEQLNEDSIKGKKILLKPNWVRHSVKEDDEICLRTNDNFLLAVLETIIAKSPSKIIIGDAPIQGCDWDRMINEDFIRNVEALSGKYNIPVIIKDFRRVTFSLSANDPIKDRKSIEDYLIFDLGTESFLEPITAPGKNLFRVTNYNPDRFSESHKPGMHKYCIAKELFDADLIISIPKVKTHQKAGITATLKNIVGLNGDKDFLPHHRLGGTDMGGDCYPGKNFLRYWAELALDNANRKQGRKIYRFWLRLASLLWRISMPGKIHSLEAGWYGNDTTWRMVMDLNKIVMFGKPDGSLGKTPQRLFYSLCDGIIGGQGDGPLKPGPLNLGVICFTNHSSLADISLATLMGLDVEKIPLLVSARKFMSGRKAPIILNGKKIGIDDLKSYATGAALPPGWIEYKRKSK